MARRGWWPCTRALFSRLLREDDGQDLLEYVLLTAAVGLAGMAGLQAIGLGVGNFYSTSNTGVNDLWQTPPPAGS
jgi:Flp pilus assembly pilin Flp